MAELKTDAQRSSFIAFFKASNLKKLHTTTGLCAGVALESRPPGTTARLSAKDIYLEPMFGDAFQARTNAAMLLMTIATTLSRTCTKPTVVRLANLLPDRQCGFS